MSNHTHSFNNWPFPDDVNTAAYCTAQVVSQQFPVLRVAHDADGDWQFLDATTDEPGECVLHCLGCVYERDNTLAEVADLPRGWSAFREQAGSPWVRCQDEPEPDEREHKALADIETYGLHIINVMAEGDLPPFSYSIGIERSLGMPELIIVGLKYQVAQSAINECYRQMKEGVQIVPGARIAGLLGGGFECAVGQVSLAHYKEYMGWALWLYEGENFRAHQIVFPSTDGVFPWEPEASDWFRNWQPLLTEEGKPGAGTVR